MRIAILGATSQIAKELIRSFANYTDYNLVLFARRPEAVIQWLEKVDPANYYSVDEIGANLWNYHFDAIINFVGVGGPAQAIAMGASIFNVTLQYDELALNYLHDRPNCRYLFLSSGAAYGNATRFDRPVDENTKATININDLRPQDWYGAAKLYAECRHRSLAHLPIVDIRVFSYFSRSQDIYARSLIADILRAIQYSEVLVVSSENIVRDYIGPDDFARLCALILTAPATNDVVDCYTKAPVDKITLLSAMRDRFNLFYELGPNTSGINATGNKLNYFSNNRRAEMIFGYHPSQTSLDVIINESCQILKITYDI